MGVGVSPVRQIVGPTPFDTLSRWETKVYPCWWGETNCIADTDKSTSSPSQLTNPVSGTPDVSHLINDRPKMSVYDRDRGRTLTGSTRRHREGRRHYRVNQHPNKRVQTDEAV